MSGQTKGKISNRTAEALVKRCPDRASMKAEFDRIRQNSVALTNPLEIEDQVVQTSEQASPTKWHLAHMTWFFETFVLDPLHPSYKAHNDAYAYLFNSYYQSVGPQFSRPRNRTDSFPGARCLAARLFTLPTHGQVTATDIRRLDSWLYRARSAR